MTRCTKCCMPDSRPDTPFVDGVCGACINYANRPNIDWGARKADLLSLLDRHDGKCIVPSSGGKDSTYQVLTLLELGADVTVVTATTCHLTPIGRANIDNLSRYARTIEVSPNKTVRAKLNRLALQMVGDISWPEHVAIHRTPFKMAADLNIPLIFYGECANAEYGGPVGTEQTRIMTQRWASEFGGFLGMRADDFVGIEGLTEKDMADYQAPDSNKLASAGVEAHFLGQYIEWDSRRNADAALRRGMMIDWHMVSDFGIVRHPPCYANWWAEENLDNAQTGLHDHMMYRKYGYGRGCSQVSIDVRSGRVSREDAMKFVKQNDGEFPAVYGRITLAEILDKIHLPESELSKIMDSFTNWDLFARVENNRPILNEFAS